LGVNSVTWYGGCGAADAPVFEAPILAESVRRLCCYWIFPVRVANIVAHAGNAERNPARSKIFLVFSKEPPQIAARRKSNATHRTEAPSSPIQRQSDVLEWSSPYRFGGCHVGNGGRRGLYCGGRASMRDELLFLRVEQGRSNRSGQSGLLLEHHR
jgi:hypothetical protein